MFLLVMFGVLGSETKTETVLTFNCSRSRCDEVSMVFLSMFLSLSPAPRLHFWSGILHRSCRLTMQSWPRCLSTLKDNGATILRQTEKTEQEELAELVSICVDSKMFFLAMFLDLFLCKDICSSSSGFDPFLGLCTSARARWARKLIFEFSVNTSRHRNFEANCLGWCFDNVSIVNAEDLENLEMAFWEYGNIVCQWCESM